MPFFKDRKDAGKKLAESLRKIEFSNPHIFALPRGGVPVAAEVANTLEAPLDILVVRKLGLPYFPELGFGAIAPAEVIVIDEVLVNKFGLNDREIDEVINTETAELNRRVQEYKAWEPIDLSNVEAIIVDDGIATGITMLAAIKFMEKFNPRELIVAVPVCPVDIAKKLQKEVDGLICLSEEMYFGAVGEFYQQFDQVADREVMSIMEKLREY